MCEISRIYYHVFLSSPNISGIFVSAKWATIWFNRVKEWSGLLEAIIWLSRKYLGELEKNGNDTLATQTTVLVSSIDEKDLKPTMVTFPRQEISSKKHRVPGGWFTSLWTLQEACLRPDLYLCNKGWKLFSVSVDSPHAAITLDDITALIGISLTRSNVKRVPRSDTPLAVYELLGIFKETAMYKLLHLTPIHVLTLGNQRYCEDPNRAIAIMSVLDVISWYPTYRQQASGMKNEDLVPIFIDKRYPIEFVEELKIKFGGTLFAAADLTNLADEFFKFSQISGQLTFTELKSTMMPFGRDIRHQRFVLPQDGTISSQDDVMTWNINSNGSVDIRKACVVASCPEEGIGEFPANVVATIHSQDGIKNCNGK